MAMPGVFAAGPLMLLALLLTLGQRSTDACMETAWSSGWLGADALIQAVTLSSATSGSCRCCALCHQKLTCASLSFNSLTNECEMYNTVASYATFYPDWDNDWAYFVMPGRSQRGQFCRRDADCTEEGDACRGRVCTDRSTVTCRDIAETFGAGDSFGDADVRMFGWLEGRETPLECDVFAGMGGFTELLSVRSGAQLDNTTILELNRALLPDTPAHSILGLADDISRLGQQDRAYHIAVSVDATWVTDESQSRVRRNQTLNVETIGNEIHISFRNMRDELILVKLPMGDASGATDTTAYTRSMYPTGNYVARLELDGENWMTAYEWVEIYIRESGSSRQYIIKIAK